MNTPPPDPIDQDNTMEFNFNPEVIQSSNHLHIAIDEDTWRDMLNRYAASTSDIAELTQSERLHHEHIAGKFFIAYQFAFRTNLSGDLNHQGKRIPSVAGNQHRLLHRPVQTHRRRPAARQHGIPAP